MPIVSVVGGPCDLLTSVGNENHRVMRIESLFVLNHSNLDCVVTPVPALEIATIMLPGGIPMEFCRIPKGEFWMGARDQFTGPPMEPRHRVQIPFGYLLGRTPVCVREFDTYCPDRILRFDSRWNSNDKQPVVAISWDEAVGFCNWLNENRDNWPTELKGYCARLPTEAQWERACRGVGGPFIVDLNSIDEQNQNWMGRVAWFGMRGDEVMPSVAQKEPTDWGLHDMHGLVWEWCSDLYSHDYYASSPQIAINPECQSSGSEGWAETKIARGGSCWNLKWECTSWYRGGFRRDHCNEALLVKMGFKTFVNLRTLCGFRVALIPEDSCELVPQQVDLRVPELQQSVSKNVASHLQCHSQPHATNQSRHCANPTASQILLSSDDESSRAVSPKPSLLRQELQHLNHFRQP